ncbi:hypothetical protein VTN31DRAFT_1825 [Thermomyces dupontii]|uniref:uncharacterized protein n=1 Tax=Talaromyces thermophilus TaxID=28565 RepID=UPI003742D93C
MTQGLRPLRPFCVSSEHARLGGHGWGSVCLFACVPPSFKAQGGDQGSKLPRSSWSRRVRNSGRNLTESSSASMDRVQRIRLWHAFRATDGSQLLKTLDALQEFSGESVKPCFYPSPSYELLGLVHHIPFQAVKGFCGSGHCQLLRVNLASIVPLVTDRLCAPVRSGFRLGRCRVQRCANRYWFASWALGRSSLEHPQRSSVERRSRTQDWPWSGGCRSRSLLFGLCCKLV